MAEKNKKTSIGGQALIEGVMMRGPQITAMAVRHVSGEIVKEQWETSGQKKAAIWRVPIIRGVYNMIDSLRGGYKCLMRSVELSGWEEEAKPAQDKTEKSKFWDKYAMPIIMVVSTVLGVALSLGLFMYLPIFLYDLVAGAIDKDLLQARFLRSLCEGVLRIAIFVGYLAAVSLMKDMRRVFMYHGAEHKTIFCYEHGNELTVENVRKEKRFHPRCGTSFMILMLIVGVFISMLIPITTPVLRTVIKLLTLPFVVGIGYELIKLAGRKDNVCTRIMSKPGIWVQKLTTREPDDQMIECAIEALLPTIPQDEAQDQW